MAQTNMISLAVWDVPMPAVAGGTFAIKVGAKSASGGALAGRRVEVSDANSAILATATLGDTPWDGTDALYWTTLMLPSPAQPAVTEYAVRLAGDEGGAAISQFSVVAAAKPEHTLTVRVTERDTKEALAGVEIRLGPFHARTGKTGAAELRLAKGRYQLQLWRTAHVAEPRPVTIEGDTNLALTMVHVPEEHPDARWVR